MAGRIEALMPAASSARIEELEALIQRVVQDVEAGRDCDALILQLDAEAGSPGYTHGTFVELHGWADPRDLAELAALGRPPAIRDLTVQEIAACLRFIGAGEEPRTSFYLGVLENSFPYLPISDMIFHPETALPNAELAAEILERGRASGPILL